MHTRIRIDTVGMHKKALEHTPFIYSKAFIRSTGSTLSSDKFGSWKGNKIYHFIIHNYINNKKSRKLITLPISREAELLSSPELISYSSSLWPFADSSSEGNSTSSIAIKQKIIKVNHIVFEKKDASSLDDSTPTSL